MQPYRLDAATGQLTFNGDLSTTGTLPPLQIEMDDTGLQLLTLTTQQLRCYLIDPATGQLTAGPPVAPPTGASAIDVQPHGNLVFVKSPAGLRAYRVEADGSLTQVSDLVLSSAGQVGIDSRGRALFVSQQNDLIGYAIGVSGALTEFYREESPHPIEFFVSNLDLLRASSGDGLSSSTSVSFLREDGTPLWVHTVYARFVDTWPGAPPPPQPVSEVRFSQMDRTGAFVCSGGKVTTTTTVGSWTQTRVVNTVSLSPFLGSVLSLPGVGDTQTLPATPDAAVDAPLSNFLYVALEGRTDLHIIPMSPTGSLGTPVLFETGFPTSSIVVTP